MQDTFEARLDKHRTTEDDIPEVEESPRRTFAKAREQSVRELNESFHKSPLSNK